MMTVGQTIQLPATDDRNSEHQGHTVTVTKIERIVVSEPGRSREVAQIVTVQCECGPSFTF